MRADPEQPFRLRRMLLVGVLPGLLLLIAAVVLATAQTVGSATTELLLQLASVKVEGLAKEIMASAPAAWRTALVGKAPTADDLAEISKALAHEQGETQVTLLKI
jgi:hypothetical protein